jgi:hypothetical protein
MRSLIVLVAMIVTTAAPVGSHDWYTGLRSPSGASCCKERDPARVRHDRKLRGTGDRQDHERPFDGPDAARGGGDRRVDHAVSVAMDMTIVVVMIVPVVVGMMGGPGKTEPGKSSAKRSGGPSSSPYR